MQNDDMNVNLSAKKRDRKIYITDIARKKIPRIKYRGLTETENDILYQLAIWVLWTSQMKNDSNEVAITCSLDMENPLDEVGISYGNEHEVDICADTLSYHLLVSGNKCVVVLHNHPSTQTLSLEDISFFMHFTSVKIIAVVTNQGNIHYLCKDDDYDRDAAKKLFKECVDNLGDSFNAKELYAAGLSFLARCSEVGLYYR